MPETSIGFIPDVGATYFLPRIENQITPLETSCTPKGPSPLGVYLALTGQTIKGIDCYWLGIATHYIPSTSLSLLEERLSELDSDDSDIVNVAIEEFCSLPVDVIKENNDAIIKLFREQKWILKHFSKRSLIDILDSLKNVSKDGFDEYKKWASNTLSALSRKSPTSLIVTLESLYQNTENNLSQCLQKELSLVNQFLLNKDFYTGVDAVLIQKTKEIPVWEPKLEEATKDDKTASSIISQYFNPPDRMEQNQVELDFDGLSKGITSCYFSKYSLPHLAMIRNFITGDSKDSSKYQPTPDEVGKYFKKKFNNKIGVELKVDSIIKEFCHVESGFLQWKD